MKNKICPLVKGSCIKHKCVHYSYLSSIPAYREEVKDGESWGQFYKKRSYGCKLSRTIIEVIDPC